MDESDSIEVEVDRRWWYHAWADSLEFFANRFTGSDGHEYWLVDYEFQDNAKSYWISENGIHHAAGHIWPSKLFDCGVATDVSDAERSALHKAISEWKTKLAAID